MALLWCVPPVTMQSGMPLAVSASSTLWLWLLAMPRPSVGVRCGKCSLPLPPGAYAAGPVVQPPKLPRTTQGSNCPALPEKDQGSSLSVLTQIGSPDCGSQVLIKQNLGSPSPEFLVLTTIPTEPRVRPLVLPSKDPQSSPWHLPTQGPGSGPEHLLGPTVKPLVL